MPLPTDFKSVIEEEYGEFGWELANCLSFVAEFLGYKVLDISSVETALKIVATEVGSSLTEYSSIDDLDEGLSISEYLVEYYPKVHSAFVEKAKQRKKSDKLNEEEREDQIIEDFIDYILYKNTSFLLSRIEDFFRGYVENLLFNDISDSFLKIKELIKNQPSD